MARIRTIKPGFFTSEDIASLSIRARLTFIGLWTHADDDGRAKDNPKLIRAAIWPLDDVSEKQVSADLDELAEAGRITRYVVDGRPYLEVTNWAAHQRINRRNPSSLPAPTDGMIRHGGLTEDSVSDHGGVCPGKEGKGREKEPSSAVADGAFDEFWNLCPRKVGKDAARKAWTSATKRADSADIIAGLRAHLPGWSRTEERFIPHPSTWLNEGRWQDEVAAPSAVADTLPHYWKPVAR